jgi:dolichyl-phosphate-mannose-protein mannosyltransferase
MPGRIGWRDHVVGALLGAAYVAWLLATARSLGFPRDEGFYFRAATGYAGWFEALLRHAHDAVQRQAIDGAWGYNHEHPALMKSLFGISWDLFHEKWKVFRDASTAFRFPGMCMAGVTAWVTYLFGARAWSRRAGALAAALLLLMPRVFFNAHLACFDVAIMAMWTLTIYVYWRSVQDGGWIRPLLVGLAFGLTLETKHNSWILPAVILPHALFVVARSMAGGFRIAKLAPLLNLVAMAVIGPLLFVGLWPWMWHDTWPRIQEYLNFHIHHEYYNMEFLGTNYFGPPSPRSYLPIMTVATVPTITMILFGAGAIDRIRDAVRRLVAYLRVRSAELSLPPDPAETDLLLALALGAAIGPWFLEKTPIFGGTKHWFPAYPFLALFAGRGFELAAEALEATLEGVARWARLATHGLLAAIVVAAPLAITAHSHPFGLSSYVPLVGGTAGGADLGLNRQFWGFTTESANAYLAPNAPRGATVFIHDTAWESWQRMLDEGRVRPDLRGVGSPGEAEFALVQHELHMNEVDYSIWVALGTDAPAYIVDHDGVPIVSVYRRR